MKRPIILAAHHGKLEFLHQWHRLTIGLGFGCGRVEHQLFELQSNLVARLNLIQRNPAINHRLAAISLNSMAKWRTRVLPTVQDFLARNGRLPEAAVFSLAALIVFYRGERGGERIALADDAFILDLFRDGWAAVRSGSLDAAGLVGRVLGLDRLWGRDMNAVPGLAGLLRRQVERILSEGMERAAAAAG